MIEILDASGLTHNLSTAFLVRIVETLTGCTIHMSNGDVIETDETRIAVVNKVKDTLSFYSTP